MIVNVPNELDITPVTKSAAYALKSFHERQKRVASSVSELCGEMRSVAEECDGAKRLDGVRDAASLLSARVHHVSVRCRHYPKHRLHYTPSS